MASKLEHRFSRVGLWRQRARHWHRKANWLFLTQAFAGFKRLFDLVTSGGLILFFLPVFTLIFAQRIPHGIHLLRLPRIGRWGEPFQEYALALPDHAIGRWGRWLRLHRLPILLNIFKGEMSWIGPRPMAPGEMNLRLRAVRHRLSVRPGLVCLWWIRRRANIDYGDELSADHDYINSQSLSRDVGIAGRTMPALFYGEAPLAPPEQITLLDISIDNLTMTDALEWITTCIRKQHAMQLCFVNADCVNLSYRHPEYAHVLRRADLALADGIGLKLAGTLLSQPVKQNVNGTDLFPRLCTMLADMEHSLFLLGAQPGVVEDVRDWIAVHHPGVRVCGSHHGYFTPAEERDVIRCIADSGADILLVAFGAPKQDIWIHNHLSELGVRVAMGVGGLFDFYSGRIPRAPLWLREMGLEWLFRFYQEPGRMWKRYGLGNMVFLFRVVCSRYRQWHRSSQSPIDSNL